MYNRLSQAFNIRAPWTGWLQFAMPIISTLIIVLTGVVFAMSTMNAIDENISPYDEHALMDRM